MLSSASSNFSTTNSTPYVSNQLYAHNESMITSAQADRVCDSTSKKVFHSVTYTLAKDTTCRANTQTIKQRTQKYLVQCGAPSTACLRCSCITAVIERYAIMILNSNAGPRTNRNILRRSGTIPDPWRTILNRRYTGLGGSRPFQFLIFNFQFSNFNFYFSFFIFNFLSKVFNYFAEKN